jgi:class 3 adenylate cyclase/dihydrofolate reductase
MRLVVVEFMTLDGVMEAPGFEEHRAGRNAWAMDPGVADAELQAYNGEQVSGADALLFGRTTFQIWDAFWPTAPEIAAEMGATITALPKYVVSKSLGRVDWPNTTVLRGDLEEEVRRLKDLPGGDLKVYGSADLVAGLLELDLVDELRILLFPVILGSGKRLFRDEASLRHLRLLGSRTFASGVVLLTYEREATAPPREDLDAWAWTDEQARSFRAVEDADRVLATVLFTDIVDSTGRAAAIGDREWRRLLDRHDEAARAEVKRWQGRLVKVTGDGILARFDAPTRALRCAFGLQSALAKLGIDIRVAIHTGEIEVRGDDDVGGIGVHIASRTLSKAEPGEVVVTRTVRDLATGTDLDFRSLGAVALRGVPEQWELFVAAVRAPAPPAPSR